MNKGWQVSSNDFSGLETNKNKNFYIIVSGNFTFKSFNKRLLPFTSKYQNRVITTMNNPQIRGGTVGTTSEGKTSTSNSILMKFVNT